MASSSSKTGLAVVSPQAIEVIDRTVRECSMDALRPLTHMNRAVQLATGIRALRMALTPEVMAPIMALQNTALGFRTDRA